MIKIFKKTYHSSVFDLNETTGQVEETTATPLSPSAAFNLDPTEGDASYDKESANPIVFYIDSNGYLVTESNVRAVAKKLQYSGTFMEIPVLSITVNSPAPIQWEIGDYILWDYDNQVYTLKNIPQVRKQARANSYGEAFVYENMQFVSVLSDLKTLEFLDVVLESPSTGNYTTLPTLSFFGDCYALIDRINANLGRLYANWEVLGADVESGDIYDALHTERNVVISAPIKVWEALGLFYSMWGLGFVYSFNSTTNKHNITIGATGGETGNFAYGQGNGLRMISQSIAKEDEIVTRLRAYGSTRNMPSRYYNNKVILIDRQLFTDPMVYLPNLMIPYWKWAYTNGDPKDAYINCNNVDVDATDTSYAKYGIREASVFFDGTNGLPDIYPTIERITAKNIRDGIAALQYESAEYPLYHSPSVAIYPDTERMDLVKAGDTLTDNGVVITTEIYTQTATFAGDTANYPTTIESFTLAFDPIYSKTLAKEGEFKATLNSQEVVLSGVDTTIDSAKLKMWLTKNGSRSVLVTTIEGSPVGGVFTFVLPDFTFTTQEEGDVYAVEVYIDITIPPIGELGIANVNYVFEAGSLTYELTKITPITTFAINVKQIGFDIKRFLPNAGQSPVISMTSGACQGREFIIKDTRYNSTTDDWTLTCARQSDTSLSNQWFPNANFHIAQGDSFVVLNINMPEFFINIAEERLYIAACDWLRKRKEPKWVFEPKVDAVYMAYNPQLIKEGMMMPLSDADLGLADSKLINTVTITENEQSIRTFDVVLREDADKDLLKYINEAAKRESSAAVGSITNADTSKSESAEKQSVVVTSSSGTAPTEHNSLEGLQGGTTSQYWHLTQAQHLIATQSATAARDGYLTKDYWAYLDKLKTYLKFTEDNTALYTTIDFYSEDGVSAYGAGIGGGGGGGYDMITDWAQYVSGKETNVVSAQLLYADHIALADKAPLSHNHDSLYLKLSGGTLTGSLNGTNATFSSYVNALGFALGAYAPYGYRFYQNDSSFAFGMYGESGVYKLQAAYQGTNSYTDFTRGFRVFNTTDNYEEFYTGKGRLELTRVMSSSSEFSSLDNGIKLDKAVLSFYQLGVGNSYARVLDIGAFGRTDYGYYGNNAESIIRFLYNTSGAYSGGVEAARFWRGSFQLGFTGDDYLAYKLAVSGDAYISGGTIVGGNFYGYGIGSFSGMVLGASFKSGNWKIIPVSTTQLQIQYNDVMMAKLDSAGNILATGGVTAYAT